MKEHTDKSPQKPGRRPPRKRGARTASPEGKRATAPQVGPDEGKAAAEGATAAAPRSALAPDPDTVVFGTNRPIVAPPPKLPESSGLRFAGPSAGVLKATGPQPSSPKASGLTFMASKPAPATAPKKPAAKKAEARKPETKKPEASKVEAPVLTKPAIAPQASGRHFDRERSTSRFVTVMLALTIVGGGLAFWTKLSNDPRPPQQAAIAAPAASEDTPFEPVVEQPAAAQAASDAPRSVEPVAEQAVLEPATPVPAEADGSLSSAEIGEIQDLLSRLDLDPGSTHGELTADTAAAIRSYQEMAGLPADGAADRALLEELRSVAALYGS